MVEAIVASALDNWLWCSADYASYDFIHEGGTRLEVKQTSIKQSWASTAEPKPSWDIKMRTGAWIDGAIWVPGPGRNADIYVFALHDTVDESADHRDPEQWRFFVLATSELPATQRLSLSKANMKAEMVSVGGLKVSVEKLRLQLADQRLTMPGNGDTDVFTQ